MGNMNMVRARVNPSDEFYTQMTDIEKELRHYREQFKGKKVFMNCDDPKESNFWRYFYLNFDFFGLKKITSTHYHPEEPTYKIEYDGVEVVKTDLEQNGDFRSSEAIEILKESDIVVTNPPFSLYREYVAQLMEYGKDFLIIGNMNSTSYKEVFPLFKEEKLWYGYNNGSFEFKVPKDFERGNTYIRDNGKKYAKFGNIGWFTNLEVTKRKDKIILYKEYNEEDYPKYDNYDVINVNRVAHIPIDYFGVMGVPITFLTRHNPEQFKIIGLSAGNIRGLAGVESTTGRVGPYIDGKLKYNRIFIQRRKQDED